MISDTYFYFGCDRGFNLIILLLGEYSEDGFISNAPLL